MKSYWSSTNVIHLDYFKSCHLVIIGVSRRFQCYFGYMWAASAPTNAFLEFFLPVFHTIFFPSHWLLSYQIIAETMDRGERGMNPVEMTIINPRKEYWPSRGLNQQPSVLKSCMLLTKLWGLACRLVHS